MKPKIAVWQEAYGSVRQTQRLFNREFGIKSAPTQQTIYPKSIETGSFFCSQCQESSRLLKSVVSR